MTDRWIVIPRWDGPDGFQHYKDRDPIFIKNYRRLLHNDSYLGLTFVQRGILHGLWLEYAASNREIRDSTSTISRRLGQRVTRASLDALNHAGFIQFCASKPLAPRYQDASPRAIRIERDEEQETEELSEGSTALESSSPNEPRPQGKNGHDFELIELHPYLERLLEELGTSPESASKLLRAARDKPEATIVTAYEASHGPGVNDPLAVALAELGRTRIVA